jgi:hypothetical protein
VLRGPCYDGLGCAGLAVCRPLPPFWRVFRGVEGLFWDLYKDLGGWVGGGAISEGVCQIWLQILKFPGPQQQSAFFNLKF